MSESKNIKLNREEIAKREIGVTHISKRISILFTIFFLCCIFSYPLLQIGYEYFILNQKPPQPLEIIYPYKITTWKKLVTSNNRFLDYIHTYENALNDHSLLRKYLLPPLQTFLFRYFHITVENVEVGKDQWFFNRGDLNYLTAPGFLGKEFQKARIPKNNPAIPDPVHTILDFHHYLSGLGIQLIILPMPVKGSLYPEKYSTHLSHVTLPLENSSFDNFKNILIQQGVLVFDPAPFFVDAKQKGVQPFLRTDTHWSSDGMLLVARELGKFVKSHVALPPQKENAYTTSISQSSTLGDLVGLSKLNHPEKYILFENINLQKIYKDRIPISNEHHSDILLMGDSFLKIYSVETDWWGYDAGLSENLSYELQRPIGTISINGGGSYAVRKDLANKLKLDKNYLAGKKLVIWEFTNNVLVTGMYGNWTEIDFDKIAKAN